MIRETQCPTLHSTICPVLKKTEECGDCGPVDAFLITTCNANAIRDDSWAVRIDGVYIGDVNIATDVAAADIFAPLSLAAYSLDPDTYTGCTSVQSRFNTAFMDTLTTGIHTMTLTNIGVNGAGNLFTINAMSIRKVGSVLHKAHIQVLADVSGTYLLGDVVTRLVAISLCG